MKWKKIINGGVKDLLNGRKMHSCKTYFKNHRIRKPIAHLGEYNLLNEGVINQFDIANNYGIDGFLIWNYWFGDSEVILRNY